MDYSVFYVILEFVIAGLFVAWLVRHNERKDAA